MKALRNMHMLSLLLAGPALALSEATSAPAPVAPLRKVGQIPYGTGADFRNRLVARTRAGDQVPVEINEAGDVFLASDFEGVVTFYAENGVTLATFDVKPAAVVYAFHEAVRAPMVPITAPPPLPAQVRPSRPSCKRGARRAARFPGSRRR